MYRFYTLLGLFWIFLPVAEAQVSAAELKELEGKISRAAVDMDAENPKAALLYAEIAEKFLFSENATENYAAKALEYYEQGQKVCLKTLADERSLKMAFSKRYLNAANIQVLQRIFNGQRKALLKRYEQTQDISYLLGAFKTTKLESSMLRIEQDFYFFMKKKADVLERSHQVHEEAIEIALRLHTLTQEEDYLKAAFFFSETDKSAILRSSLRKQRALKAGGIPDSLVQLEYQLLHDLASYEQQLADAVFVKDEAEEERLRRLHKKQLAQVEELQLHIENEYPKYFQLRYSEKIAGVEDIQRQLPKGQGVTVLQYFIGQRGAYLFTITEDDFQVVQKPCEKDFVERFTALSRSISDIKWVMEHPEQAYQDYTSNAYTFYKRYFESYLPEGTRALCITADGLLNYLPFEVLLTKKPGRADDYSDLAYLVKELPISYSYSATLFLENLALKEEESFCSSDRILGFAATYPEQPQLMATRGELTRSQVLRQSLTAIPEVLTEVQELERRFDGDFFYGEAANEQTFKKYAGEYSVVHLAMHGLIDEDNPLASSLAFTDVGNMEEDDFLHAYEMMELGLNAEMVVLSACETGFGKFQNGEGVLSLARAFMFAGTPSLLVSLWEVSDKSTATLMNYFYEELYAGKWKNEALRDAKLRYIQENKGFKAHPFFWAPFVNIGHTCPVKLRKAGTPGWLWLVAGGSVLSLGVWRYRRWQKEV